MDVEQAVGVEERVVVVVAFGSGGEHSAFGGGGGGIFDSQRCWFVADVIHRHHVVRVLARDEVVDELVRPPDLEGIEFVLAPVVKAVVNAVLVRRKQLERTAGGGESLNLSMRLPLAAGPGDLIVIHGDGVFRIRRNRRSQIIAGRITVVEAKLVAAAVEQKERPARVVRAGADTGAPDRLVVVECPVRPLYHHLDLVGGGIRRVVRRDSDIAVAQDIFDFGIAGRQRPRREHVCRGHRRKTHNTVCEFFNKKHSILLEILVRFYQNMRNLPTPTALQGKGLVVSRFYTYT